MQDQLTKIEFRTHLVPAAQNQGSEFECPRETLVGLSVSQYYIALEGLRLPRAGLAIFKALLELLSGQRVAEAAKTLAPLA